MHWADWHNISENKHGDQPCFIGTEDLKYVEAFGNKDSDYTEVNEITMKKRRITKDATMHPLKNKLLSIIHKTKWTIWREVPSSKRNVKQRHR